MSSSRLANATIHLVLVHVLWFGGVLDAVHCSVAGTIHAEAGSSARTATLALVVAGKRITSSELPSAFLAGVGPLSRMQLLVTLQIVQPPKPGIAGFAFVRLLLAVCKQVTLEVMVASKVGGTIWAFVSSRTTTGSR